MRLRRETGDWTIKVNVDDPSAQPKLLTSQLPKGLSAEDFIGVIFQIESASISGYKTIAEAYDFTGEPYSVRIALGNTKGMQLYYDRRSGHLSFDENDFDPVEPDADFVVTSEDGTEIDPAAIDSNLTREYFIGKTVKTNKGVYTITNDMLTDNGEDGSLTIYYTGNETGPYITYGPTSGRLAHGYGDADK